MLWSSLNSTQKGNCTPKKGNMRRDGSAKTLSHRMRIRSFLSKLIASHRTFFASHSHRTFRIFFAFSPFLHLLGRYFTVNAPKSCEMCETNAQNMKKRKKKNCENAKNAKKCGMRMRCEHGIKIRIASHYCNKFFSHFFASHSHRTTIPELIWFNMGGQGKSAIIILFIYIALDFNSFTIVGDHTRTHEHNIDLSSAALHADPPWARKRRTRPVSSSKRRLCLGKMSRQRSSTRLKGAHLLRRLSSLCTSKWNTARRARWGKPMVTLLIDV